ncbi:MAG TPA: tRNA adenosine deaminase-associated protein [Marmoricola sp.]|nr:tRNA adenosine deaminase-associated protein [Marmoricola sp.]
MSDAEVGRIDLAIVAYRDEGEWTLAELPEQVLDSVATIVAELRRYPGETGTLAFLAVDEDFALVIRVLGSTTRVLLSDATAATDWELARAAVDLIGTHVNIDDDDPIPAGDLGIVADLGMPADDLADLLDDLDLYPEEILSEIAERIGIGASFNELTGLD